MNLERFPASQRKGGTMYRTISDFTVDWKDESAATLKVLHSLTDGSLHQKVTPEGRSLGFLAWHLVLTLTEMGSKMGLQITGPAEDSEQPTSVSEIASTYDISAKSVGEVVRTTWSDAALDEKIDMYGEMWKRGAALASLVKTSDPPSRSNDGPDETGRPPGTGRLWSIQGRMGQNGHTPAEIGISRESVKEGGHKVTKTPRWDYDFRFCSPFCPLCLRVFVAKLMFSEAFPGAVHRFSTSACRKRRNKLPAREYLVIEHTDKGDLSWIHFPRFEGHSSREQFCLWSDWFSF